MQATQIDKFIKSIECEAALRRKRS